MSKQGEKLMGKLSELYGKIDINIDGIMRDVSNLSDEDKVKLSKSGKLDELHESMSKLDGSMTKLQEKIKKKNG